MKWFSVGGLSLVVASAISSLLCGCDDPIQAPAELVPDQSDLALPVASDSSKYDWRYSHTGYLVEKPPLLAFITRISRPLSRDVDPVSAKVVPWSPEEVNDSVDRFLRHAFEPRPTELNIVLRLDTSTLNGPQAYDVSRDGRRLVTAGHQKLSLYNAQSGVHLGDLSVPDRVRSNGKIYAVRFAGKTKDLLLATENRIFRLSSKDASISHERELQETIIKWEVSDQGTLAMLTESGQLLIGDTDLKTLVAESSPSKFLDIALRRDGRRLVTWLEGRARAYSINNHTIVDWVDYDPLSNASEVIVGSGKHNDVLTDGDRFAFHSTGSKDQEQNDVFRMFWKPLEVVMCENEEVGSWSLIVGQRFGAGRTETILFDFEPVQRIHSIAVPLQSKPTRVVSDTPGTVVAMADKSDLFVARREAWWTPSLSFQWDLAKNLLKEGNTEHFKKMIEIIRSQDRLGFGLTPEHLAGFLVDSVGHAWGQTTDDSTLDVSLHRLYSEGDPLAILAHAIRQVETFEFAAEAFRYMSGSYLYERFPFSPSLAAAMEDVDRVLNEPDPLLQAYLLKLQLAAVRDGLEGIDKICRECVQRYPGETKFLRVVLPFVDVGWYGEPGDYLSFAYSFSRIFDGPEGDLQYMVAVSQMPIIFHPQDEISWKSYDADRVKRGYREYIRRRMHVVPLLRLAYVLRARFAEEESVEEILRYVISESATNPHFQGVEIRDRLLSDVDANFEVIDRIRDP